MKNSIFVMLVAVFISCETTEQTKTDVDWNKLKEAVINQDIDLADQELSKLLVNTNPTPNSNDAIGQRFNIDELVQSINESNVLTSELYCYACIKTLPAQTEIVVEVDSTGTSIKRVIDIVTTEDGILRFGNMHEFYLQLE